MSTVFFQKIYKSINMYMIKSIYRKFMEKSIKVFYGTNIT
nr:MAG TPA: hypothetical protein [Caudoviricetes sp.]